MFCKECGTEVPDDVKFCPKCGYNFTQADGANSVTIDSLVKRWDSYNGEQKLIRVIFICCVGLFIMGFILALVSPDANASSVYSSSDFGSFDEVADNAIVDSSLDDEAYSSFSAERIGFYGSYYFFRNFTTNF